MQLIPDPCTTIMPILISGKWRNSNWSWNTFIDRQVYMWTCIRKRLDSSLDQAEWYDEGCSWLWIEWWHWLRRRHLTSHSVFPPLLLDRWRHCVKMAEDVLSFTNKCWPSHRRPLSYTVHSPTLLLQRWLVTIFWDLCISRSHTPTLRAKNCRKFLDLYARIYRILVCFYWVICYFYRVIICICWKVIYCTPFLLSVSVACIYQI